METGTLTNEALEALDEVQRRIRLDSLHRYLVYRPDEGKWVSYSGVTSVMSDVLAKPALMQWAVSQERSWDIGVAYSLPAKKDESPEEYARRFNAKAGKPGAYRQTSEAAAARGHVVHAAIEAYMRKRMDLPFEVPEMSDTEKQMFRNFAEWEKGHPIVPIRAESKVCDDDLRYAGTFDLLCEIEGQLVLADFKTGKVSDRTFPEHSLQNSAYGAALMKLGFPPMRGLIIQVDRELGPTRAHWLEDDLTPAFESFKSLMSVRRYLNERDSLLPPPEES